MTMGWTGIERPTTATQYLLQGSTKLDILASNTVGRATYFAVRNADGSVRALVVLREKYGRSYLFKVIGEEQGPYYCEASQKVLSLLTDCADETSMDWRQKCRATLAKKAEAKANPFKVDDEFQYCGHDYAVTEVLGRTGYIIRNTRNGKVYRLPNTRVKDCVRIARAVNVDFHSAA
jgi:hypothetical protein